MKVKCDQESGLADVQMAPLIDCVFLLLIFFLVASTLKKAHKEVEINLPDSAAAAKTQSEANTLIIEMIKDGSMFIESEPMSRALMHKRLREAAIEAPNREVRIDADRATAMQHVVRLIDLLEFEGLKNVAIRTRD